MRGLGFRRWLGILFGVGLLMKLGRGCGLDVRLSFGTLVGFLLNLCLLRVLAFPHFFGILGGYRFLIKIRHVMTLRTKL